MFAEVHQITSLFSSFSLYYYFTITSFDLTEANDAVDLTYYSWIGRITRLKQFGHARKSSGNVTCFSGHTRNLYKHLTGLDLRSLVDNDMRAYRNVIGFQRLMLLIHDPD